MLGHSRLGDEVMRLPIAASIGLLAASPAAAENWVRLSGDDAAAATLVDAESVVRTGDRARFTVELRWPATRPEGWDRQRFTGLATCGDGKVAILAMSMHHGDHELMSMTYREDRAEAEAVDPASALGLAAAHACAGAAAG
jgi:hypothetical protein